MYSAGLNQYDYFFKTDHHWKPEGAFWAFQRMAEHLKDKYGFDIDYDVVDLKNYSLLPIKSLFLGSYGRRVSFTYDGIDECTLITPNFNTNLTYRIYTENKEYVGDYLNTVIRQERMSYNSVFSQAIYSAYLGGDYGFSATFNENAKTNKRILIIKDSFSWPFCSFMSLAVKEQYIVDMRYINRSKVWELYDQIKPDVVIVLYHARMMDQLNMFDFGIVGEHE